MIVDPPFVDGGVNDTVSKAFPPATEVIVAAPGTSAGTTGDEALEAGPTEPFVAWTVNVYDWPLVRPDTTHGVCGVLQVLLPGVDVTVYSVIGDPPFDTGAAQDTSAEAIPATPDTPVGAPGATLLIVKNCCTCVAAE